MALSANKTRTVESPDKSHPLELTAADSQVFYVGALCVYNSTGLIEVGADAASKTFAGVCVEDLTTGTSNTAKVKLKRGHVEHLDKDADLTAAHCGTNVCLVDDATVGRVADVTNPILVGQLLSVSSAGKAVVWIGEFVDADANQADGT